MGVKVRGNMWCPECECRVAAQKSTHRLRNTASVFTAPVTGGASLLGATAGEWHCPNCGAPAVPFKSERQIEDEEYWRSLPLGVRAAWIAGGLGALMALGAIVEAVG